MKIETIRIIGAILLTFISGLIYGAYLERTYKNKI